MFVTISANIVIRLFDFGFSKFDCLLTVKALNLHFAALPSFTASRASPLRAVWVLYLFAFSAIATNYHSFYINLFTQNTQLCNSTYRPPFESKAAVERLYPPPNPKRFGSGLSLILDKLRLFFEI